MELKVGMIVDMEVKLERIEEVREKIRETQMKRKKEWEKLKWRERKNERMRVLDKEQEKERQRERVRVSSKSVWKREDKGLQ